MSAVLLVECSCLRSCPVELSQCLNNQCSHILIVVVVEYLDLEQDSSLDDVPTKTTSKPANTSIFATAGSKKKLEKKRPNLKGVPMPVAPPRLPSSTSNSAAVTPTSLVPNKLFAVGIGAGSASFDDPSQELNVDNSNSLQTGSSFEETISIDDQSTASAQTTMSKTVDLEQAEIKYGQRRPPPISKLMSLQNENDVSFDGSAGDCSSGFGTFEDSLGKLNCERFYHSSFVFCFRFRFARLV